MTATSAASTAKMRTANGICPCGEGSGCGNSRPALVAVAVLIGFPLLLFELAMVLDRYPSGLGHFEVRVEFLGASFDSTN